MTPHRTENAWNHHDSVVWRIEDGWITARSGRKELLKTSTGWPCDVVVDDRPLSVGTVLSVTDHPIPEGGWSTTYLTKRGKLEHRYVPFPPLGKDAWKRSLIYTNTSKSPQDLTRAVLRYRPSVAEGGCVWFPGRFWMAEAAPKKSIAIAFEGTTDYYKFRSSEGTVSTEIEAAWRLQPGQVARIGNGVLWFREIGPSGFRSEIQRWFTAVGMVRPEAHPEWLPGAVLYSAAAGGHADSRFSDVGGFENFRRQLPYLADLGVTAIWYGSVHSHKKPPDAVLGRWNHYDPLDFTEIDPILGGSEAFGKLIRETRRLGIHPIGEIVLHGGHSIQSARYPEWWIRNRNGSIITPWGDARVMDYSSPEWQEEMKNAVRTLASKFGIEGVRIDVAAGHGPNWGSPRTNQASFSTLAGSLEMLSALRDGLSQGGGETVLIPEAALWPEFFKYGTVVGYGFETTDFFVKNRSILVMDPAKFNRRLRRFFETERGSLPRGSFVLRTLNNHDTVIAHGRTQARFGYGPARALYGVCCCVPGIPMLYQEEEIGSFEALRKIIWARRSLPEMAGEDADYFSVSFAPEVFSVLRSKDGNHALGLVNLSGKTVCGTVSLPDKPGLFSATQVYDAVSGKTAAITGGSFAWTLKPYQTSLLRIGVPPVKVPGGIGLFKSFHTTQEGTCSKSQVAQDPRSLLPAGLHPVARMDVNRILIRSGSLVADLTLGSGNWVREIDEPRQQVYRNDSSRVILLNREDGIGVEITWNPERGGLPPTLFVRNVETWYVSARTALLEDKLVRRHFPFPAGSDYRWDRTMVWGKDPWGGLYDNVAPTGRLWQSVLEPLHPQQPGLLFRDGLGMGLVVSDLRTNAENIVLTDRTDEPEAEPYGLALRFYSQDTDLAPRVRAFGYGQMWEMDSYPEPASEPLSVSFRLAGWDPNQVPALLEATRLPFKPTGALEERKGNAFSDFFQSVYLQQPGEIIWSNLAPVEGSHRIVFELRQSERSPDEHELEPHYKVSVNGIKQELEWFKPGTSQFGNSYFGYARTEPIDLSHGNNRITIRTTHPWCAVRKRFRLVPSEP